MIKQVVEISSDDFILSLFRGFLCITDKQKDQKYKVPLDSILCLIISAHNTVISKNITNALCENQACIIFCDNKYIPNAITIPVAGHWLTASRIRTQIFSSEPLRKNLWKKIVQYKIENQCKLMSLIKPESIQIPRMEMLLKTVKSDDAQNNEGLAAHIYFSELFGNKFVRNRDANDINLFLNYAYTVLRAMVARSVCANGLLPYLGLKHCQQSNTMPLVDDLIEPFRPIADKVVIETFESCSETKELTPEIKRNLTSLTNVSVGTPKGKLPLSEAINDFVLSLVKSYENKKVLLKCPKLF